MPIIKVILEVPNKCNLCAVRNSYLEKCKIFNADLKKNELSDVLRCQECKDAEAQYKKDEEDKE